MTVEAEMYAMPYLIINMGAEMLYILEQRLKAQNIPEDKGLRVHEDVLATMFSEKFISELFKPQRIYSTSATRQIFDRLAHSSIMRLNETSMNKLHDLMTMGAKYQVLAVNSARQLEDVTLTHLEALRKIVQRQSVISLIDSAIGQARDLFASFSPSDWVILRQSLCRFFQDKRVKVSLFLHNDIQSSDGSIVCHHTGPLGVGCEKPGTIRYFEDGKMREEKVAMKNSMDTLPPVKRSILGENMYAKDRRKEQSQTALTKHKFAPNDNEKPIVVDEASKEAAKRELNTLAQMLGGVKAEKMMMMSLFPDADSKDGSDGEVITFDAEDAKAYMASLRRAKGLWADQDLTKKKDDDDDLLALMDLSDVRVASKGGGRVGGGALGPSIKKY